MTGNHAYTGCLYCGDSRCHHSSEHPETPPPGSAPDLRDCRFFVPYHPPRYVECMCGAAFVEVDCLGNKVECGLPHVCRKAAPAKTEEQRVTVDL